MDGPQKSIAKAKMLQAPFSSLWSVSGSVQRGLFFKTQALSLDVFPFSQREKRSSLRLRASPVARFSVAAKI